MERRPSEETDKACLGVGRTASRGLIGRLEFGDEWGRAIQNSTTSVRRLPMVPSVKKVVPGDDYVLSIVFDNGECGTLDMKPFLDFGVFQGLRDIELFKQVKVAFDTIE